MTLSEAFRVDLKKLSYYVRTSAGNGSELVPLNRREWNLT